MAKPNLKLDFRAREKADTTFLKKLFIANTKPLFAYFPPEQQDMFISMQLVAQQQDYQTRWPKAKCTIILFNSEPAGQFLVDKSGQYFFLIDIAILPEYQNSGIATHVLQTLIKDASSQKMSIRLSVLKQNPALQLYKRIGFNVIGENDIHFKMENKYSPSD